MAEWVKTYKTRDEKVQEALERLDAGVVGFFQSNNFREYLKFMGRFHHYSLNNQILIGMQKPGAVYLAGYKDWQNKFHRHVKRGEKGILILAPVIKKVEVLTGRKDENGDPEFGQEKRVVGFTTAYVYDASQTDGEPLPDIGIHRLNPSEKVKDFERIRNALFEITDCRVFFGDLEGHSSDSNGFYNRGDHSIHIREGMSDAQTLKTLVHEITHSILHREVNLNKSKQQMEIEAESTAFIVCDYLGIDTSEYSFGYVSTWSRGQKPSELKECLASIRTTANRLMNELDQRLGIESSLEQRRAASMAEEVKGFVEEAGIPAEAVAVIDQRKPRRNMVMLVTNQIGSYRAEFHLRGDPGRLKRLLKSPHFTFEYLDRKLEEEGFFVEVLPVQEGHIYDFSYTYDTKQFAQYREAATDSPTAVVAVSGKNRETAAYQLNDAVPMLSRKRFTILPHRTDTEPLTDANAFSGMVSAYEQKGYSAQWPMVSIVYSSTDKAPLKSMNIYEFQKMLSHLPERVLENERHYMKLRISYVLNDQQEERVLDLDLGRGDVDYLKYLKLPASTITYLKIHSSILQMMEFAEDLADGTKMEGYGAEYADKIEEWAEYCRMELNHNSDRPKLPEAPVIDSRYQVTVEYNGRKIRL